MKNYEKIAKDILAASKQQEYKIPFELSSEAVMGISNPDQPRIILDLSKVAAILEEKFKTKKGKTEISQGKNNEIIFDLEWLK